MHGPALPQTWANCPIFGRLSAREGRARVADLTPSASDATTVAVLTRINRRVRGALVVALSALGVCVAQSANAQALDGGDGEDYAAPKAERRDGFMASLQADYGFAGVEGYPNKLGQIGDPAYRSYIGGLGGNLSIVLGGAIRDWLTAGLLLRGASVQGEQNIIGTMSGIGLQLQGFPLWTMGGIGRNLGVTGEFGVGIGSIFDYTDKNDPDILADGGAMSHLGIGLSYEVFKFWLFSAGPVVGYTHQFSESMSSHLVSGGMKLTLYSGQP